MCMHTDAIGVPKAGEGAHIYIPEESIIYAQGLLNLCTRGCSAWPKSTARAAFQPIKAGENKCG